MPFIYDEETRRFEEAQQIVDDQVIIRTAVSKPVMEIERVKTVCVSTTDIKEPR